MLLTVADQGISGVGEGGVVDLKLQNMYSTHVSVRDVWKTHYFSSGAGVHELGTVYINCVIMHGSCVGIHELCLNQRGKDNGGQRLIPNNALSMNSER